MASISDILNIADISKFSDPLKIQKASFFEILYVFLRFKKVTPYKMHLVAACGVFSFKHMWLDTVVSGFTPARDLSWSLSCPSQGGSSLFFPFFGWSVRCVSCHLVLVAWIALYLGLQLPLRLPILVVLAVDWTGSWCMSNRLVRI